MVDRKLEAFARRVIDGARLRLERIAGSRSEVLAVTVNDEAVPRFVVKETSPPEITALQRFEQAGVAGVARVTATDWSSSGRPLLMMPWYPGEHGDFGAMPNAAIEALAHIHSLDVGGFEGVEPLSFETLAGWAFGDMSIYAGDLHRKASALRGAMPDFEALSANCRGAWCIGTCIPGIC